MANKILIMGLPGSGKTTLASALKKYIEVASVTHMPNNYKRVPEVVDSYRKTVTWFNADEVRKEFNDWDFSSEGRIRQSKRMAELALKTNTDFAMVDFVAPLVEMRNNFKANWTIWVDTIAEGRYADTNKAFVPPDQYDFRVTEQNAEKWAEFIGNHIIEDRRRPTFDWQKPTVQMLGRWQPWHDGHRALFDKLIRKTGQVIIQTRDCQGVNGENPFEISKVERFIRRDLDPIYQGQYEIQVVPNIVHIGYGRSVGYTISQEVFDNDIADISATNIRKELGLN